MPDEQTHYELAEVDARSGHAWRGLVHATLAVADVLNDVVEELRLLRAQGSDNAELVAGRIRNLRHPGS